jgi:hypothetical protein
MRSGERSWERVRREVIIGTIGEAEPKRWEGRRRVSELERKVA